MERMTMEIGFTGTQAGMQPPQRAAVVRLVEELGVEVLHLGDCIGADAEAWEIATDRGIWRVGHPPKKPDKRAFLQYDETRQPLHYYDRNDRIAVEGKHGLVAAPPTSHEFTRSGTWMTVRRGRKHGRTIWKVYPDGRVETEGPGGKTK